MIVKGDDIFCDQWGSGLSVPSVWVNHYKVDLIEVIDTHGPAIEGLAAKRLTEKEWEEIISLKDKPRSFVEETFKKSRTFPIYFRSEQDFLIQIEKEENGKPHERILFTEIVRIVKPYNAQLILKKLEKG